MCVAGVSRTLYDRGIYNMTTWMGAISGGGWHMSLWYSAMIDKNEMTDPIKAFQAIKSRLVNNAYPDVVNENEVWDID